MKRLFDFRCPQGHTFEAFVETDVRDLPCEVCEAKAMRCVSYGGPVLDPISGDYPSATRRWALNRQMKIKEERRQSKSHGPS